MLRVGMVPIEQLLTALPGTSSLHRHMSATQAHKDCSSMRSGRHWVCTSVAGRRRNSCEPVTTAHPGAQMARHHQSQPATAAMPLCMCRRPPAYSTLCRSACWQFLPYSHARLLRQPQMQSTSAQQVKALQQEEAMTHAHPLLPGTALARARTPPVQHMTADQRPRACDS